MYKYLISLYNYTKEPITVCLFVVKLTAVKLGIIPLKQSTNRCLISCKHFSLCLEE